MLFVRGNEIQVIVAKETYAWALYGWASQALANLFVMSLRGSYDASKVGDGSKACLLLSAAVAARSLGAATTEQVRCADSLQLIRSPTIYIVVYWWSVP